MKTATSQAAQECWNSYLYGLTPSEFVGPFDGDFDKALDSFMKEVFEDNCFGLDKSEMDDEPSVRSLLAEYYENY